MALPATSLGHRRGRPGRSQDRRRSASGPEFHGDAASVGADQGPPQSGGYRWSCDSWRRTSRGRPMTPGRPGAADLDRCLPVPPRAKPKCSCSGHRCARRSLRSRKRICNASRTAPLAHHQLRALADLRQLVHLLFASFPRYSLGPWQSLCRLHSERGEVPGRLGIPSLSAS